MPFRNLTIRSKLLILLVIGAIGVAAIAAISLFEQRRTLIEDRKVKTQHIVESAYGVLAHFDRLAQSGKMPPDEARKAAADTRAAVQPATAPERMTRGASVTSASASAITILPFV